MDVLDKYIRIAFADITEYVSFGQRGQQVIGMHGPLVDKGTKKPIIETVNFVDLNKSSHIDGAIVTEVKQGKDSIGIKLADKMKALDFQAKHFDLLGDREQRQLHNEQARLNIDKTKVEIEKLGSDDQNGPIEIKIVSKKENDIIQEILAFAK